MLGWTWKMCHFLRMVAAAVVVVAAAVAVAVAVYSYDCHQSILCQGDKPLDALW